VTGDSNTYLVKNGSGKSYIKYETRAGIKGERPGGPAGVSQK
jgi:hypothetical protein